MAWDFVLTLQALAACHENSQRHTQILRRPPAALPLGSSPPAPSFGIGLRILQYRHKLRA